MRWGHLAKEENVFIKIQIEKNHVSKNFKLSVHFDENAPNFLTQANQMYWTPTSEEMKFLIEMYEIIFKNNTENTNNFTSEKQLYDPLLDKKNDDFSDHKDQQSNEVYLQKEKPDIFSNDASDFQARDTQHQEELFESPQEKTSDKQSEESSDDKDVFVQINDNAIDTLLKKKHQEKQDSFSYEEDKRSIDALLKKSKQKP